MNNAKIEIRKFLPILRGIKEVTKEARFKVNSEGLTCREMDPANVLIADISIKPECFQELNGELEFNINVGDFWGLLKEHKTKNVTFWTEDNKLKGMIEGLNFELPLVEREGDPQKIPELNFNFKGMINTKDFLTAVKMSGVVSESITLSYSENSLNFEAGGELKKVTGNLKVVTDCSNLLKCKYSTDYLKVIMGFNGVNKDNMGLEYSEDYPGLITFKNNGILVKCLLAPRVENDN